MKEIQKESGLAIGSIYYHFENKDDKINNTGLKKNKKIDIYTDINQFFTFFRRNLTMKFRNFTNLVVTFGGTPLLALIISIILRLSKENEAYSFFNNINIGNFIFISIIVFIFLGMSNSIEEFTSERLNIIREKMLNFRVSNYLFSKLLALSIFAIIQIIIYLIISKYILLINGVFIIYFIYLFTAQFIGTSIGLFFSSILHDSKTAINILPLILIPQIIFGGAIIEFEKMNHQIKFEKTNPIPEVVKIMPSYYLFEGLYTAQAKLNPYDRKMDMLNSMQNKSSKTLNLSSEDRFEIYRKKRLVAMNFPMKIYTNDYVNMAVNIIDGRFLNQNKNQFLSSKKSIGNLSFATYYLNLIILLIIGIIINSFSYIKLKFFYLK
jgi:hypothetical protein